MAKVRIADVADVEALIAMGHALHAESPRYRAMRFDPDKLRHLAAQLLEPAVAAHAVMLVVEADDGEVVGMLVGLVQERWFGPDRYATDLTVYVKPEHRGTRAFLRLVQAFEAWAADMGVTEVDIGVSTDIGTDSTVHAYQRLGYTLSPTRIVHKALTHGS